MLPLAVELIEKMPVPALLIVPLLGDPLVHGFTLLKS
jgi:hypothetical protein